MKKFIYPFLLCVFVLVIAILMLFLAMIGTGRAATVTLSWDNGAVTTENSALASYIETSVEYKLSSSETWNELGSVNNSVTTLTKALGDGYNYGDSVDFRARARFNTGTAESEWSDYCDVVTAVITMPVAGKPTITIILIK